MRHEHDYNLNSGHVLIADDDDDFRCLLVRRAKKMGLTVEEASDGAQAMEAIGRTSFDALVLDLYMPGASGLDILRAATRTDPELQALILTANATLETAIEALRAGAYDYLTKPLDSLAVFELALTRALEHRFLLQENARLFAEVQRLAVTDPLTSLYNRHKLNETLMSEVERALRYDRPLSLIMIDLDDLKHFNDSYGHSAGDQVLKEVARAIRQEIRRVDVPTRFGGDEFLVILPEADLEEAAAVAMRIHRRGRSIEHKGESISFSVGVSQLREGTQTADAFLHDVDQALYLSKRRGRGSVTVGDRVIVRSEDPDRGGSAEQSTELKIGERGFSLAESVGDPDPEEQTA